MSALLLFLFFYPWALAHLGVNDLMDVKNDLARGMKSVTVLFGVKGTVRWILLFTVVHLLVAAVFLRGLGTFALYGFGFAFLLLSLANFWLLKEKSGAGLKVLVLFHMSLFIYAVSIIFDCI